MKTVCVNHEGYLMGTIIAIYHEDENFLEVGDEAVIGTCAYKVTESKFTGRSWMFICEDNRRQLSREEVGEVFKRCPHHNIKHP